MTCIYCGAQVPTAAYCCRCGTKQRGVTLGECYKSWSTLHYRKIGYKCKAGYESAWKTLSSLAEKPMESLTLADYQAAMDTLADKSLSLQNKLRSLISQLCKYAVLLKIDQRDYAPYLILDGYEGESREIFSDDEISRLFFYANAYEKYSADAKIVLLLIFTGLRPEELFEIKKADVKLVKGYIIADGSKTDAGRNRLIPIMPVITPFVLDFLTSRHSSPYFVTTQNGCKVDLDNWRTRRFYFLMAELGINPPDNPHRIVPYCCRHTYATLANRAGVDKEALIKMIGHEDYTTTETYYIHAGLLEKLPQLQQESDKINELAQTLCQNKRCDDLSHLELCKERGVSQAVVTDKGLSRHKNSVRTDIIPRSPCLPHQLAAASC